MDIEELLRERLGPASAQPLPSPGFEARVRRGLGPRSTGRRFTLRVAESLIGLAAAAAVLAVAVPWLVGPRSGFSGPVAATTHVAVLASATPSATPAATPAPTATPVPQVHVDRWFLSFDYPATWTLRDRNIFTASHGLSSGSVAEGRVFGFVGNGTASETCANNACTTEWSLAENSVVMRFEAVPRLGSAFDTIWTSREANRGSKLPGATELVVDHLPARAATSTSEAVPYSNETAPAANEVLWFGIPSQTIPGFGWVVVAAIRGPNVAELDAEARAVVDSIRFQEPVKLLPTETAELERARSQALERYFAQETAMANDEHFHSWDCFPRIAGASQQATITQNPFTNPLTRPLPVTCKVESMEPNAMQGWTIVLSETWQAGADYPAGSARWYETTAGDGTPQEGGIFAGDPSTGDYPHQGTSKYPG